MPICISLAYFTRSSCRGQYNVEKVMRDIYIFRGVSDVGFSIFADTDEDFAF